MNDTPTAPTAPGKCVREADGHACGHPHTFHGGDKNPGKCRAMGCHCKGYVSADALVANNAG